MPSTVNGIGTTYFGTWNRQTQDAVCESCHRRGKLVSYETWHCICVLFIPIIPLGKKQILNYCPSCTRHRVMPYRDWVQIRDKAIGETMNQVTSSPDDPEAGIQMHATLAAFQKGDEANRFAKVLEQKFADVPRVQFYLAAWYERLGKAQVANRLFLRAFELAPDDIDIRRAALLTFVEQGDVDRAKSLIEPFLPGSPNFQPSISYALATGFQKLGRHQEAVQTLRMLLAASPGLKSDKTFRKTLASCEKALGVDQLTLPADPFYKSTAFMWSLVVAAAVIAVAGWNYYVATHRTLYIVNGLPATTISVKIDGGTPVEVGPRGRKEFIVAEGTHEAEIAGSDVYPKCTFQFSSGWWERFARSPVYIADPTHSTAIKWEQATYAPAGQGAQALDNQFELRLGESFTSYKHVDYRFAEFPAQIEMKKNSGPVTKSRIAIATEGPEEIVQMALVMGRHPSTLLTFLETHLQVQPDQDNLLRYYAAFSMSSDKVADCRQFLSKRLADRPVRIQWHRWYQIVNTRGMQPDAARRAYGKLKKDYDELLDQDPQNASLLYLRGRLEDRVQDGKPFFERALAADPRHPYALFASSHQRLVVGEFSEALELLERAIAGRPGDIEFEMALENTRLAAGELQTLEKVARQDLGKASLDTSAMATLTKVMVLTGRAADADRELEKFGLVFRQQAPPEQYQAVDQMRWRLAILKEDFAALSQQLANRQDPAAARFAFFAKLSADQLPEVPAAGKAANAAYWHLCRELVARRTGDAEQAAASHAAALELLDQGVSQDWNVTDALRRSSTITFEDAQGLSISPGDKAVVLVALAQERPDLRSNLLSLAEKLNFDPDFPHHVVKRSIDDLRTK